MITNYVKAKLIIASIYDEFNIQSRDWEARAAKWIADNLKHLEISLQYGSKTTPIEFTNYEFELPCDIRVLREIIVNNIKLDYTTVTGFELARKGVKEEGITDLRYYTIDNGIVKLEMEKGTAHVVYTNIPLDWDERHSMYFPRVPDVQAVIDNTKWYIMKHILARGYKHPVYSLTSNSAYNNPDIRWVQTTKEARFRARSMTKQQRRIMAETLSEFINDRNPDINTLLTEQYRTNLTIEE